jgi:iron complex outermembrane receptor protein
MKTTNLRALTLGSASLIAISMLSPFTAVQAQTADAASENPSKDITEVIVTAQRRSQSVQKTALAITAVKGDELIKAGAADVNLLTKLAPSIQVLDRGSGVNIAIRGVVNGNPSVQGDPALAMNVDDVVVGRQQASNGAFFDINRVEILRGPQGTVYGRNATAGAINIISNDPSNHPEGSVALDVGNYNASNLFAMVNLPISQTLAVRAAVQTLYHDGYIDNQFNDAHDIAGRVKLLWKPTEDISFLFTGATSHKGGHGTADVIYPIVDPSDPYANTAYPDDFGHWDNNSTTLSGKLTWNLGGSTLTYIAAKSRMDNDQDNAQNGAVAYQTITADQITHELRLASNASGNDKGTLKWVAGLYYFKEDAAQFGLITQPFVPKTYTPTLISNNLEEPNIDSQSVAAFAQATYSLTNKIRMTLGLRYTEDEKSETGQETIHLGPNTLIFPATGNPHFHNLSYKLNIEADLAPDILAYADVSTGYHAGGVFEGPPPADTYQPEYITAYQAGFKSRWFDRRLRLNADAYYYDYTNYQSTQIIPPFIVAFFNAQKAHAQGAELETSWLATTRDIVNFSVSYEDAIFDRFFVPSPPFNNPGTGTTVDGGFQYDGQTLPFVAKWSGNAGYQHIFQFGSGATLTPAISATFRSSTLSSNIRIKGYIRTDLNLTYSSADTKWSASAYVRNLQDKVNYTSLAAIAGHTYVTLMAPRTYGVRLSRNF